MKVIAIYICLLFLGCNAESEKKVTSYNKEIESTDTIPSGAVNQNILPYEKWQDLKGDTLAYLVNDFVNRKDFYINKPLSTLLKDFELPIINHSPNFSYPPKGNNLLAITFKFEKDEVFHHKFKLKKVPNILIVYLESSLTNDEVADFYRKTKLPWSKELVAFFGNEIIKDVQKVKDNR